MKNGWRGILLLFVLISMRCYALAPHELLLIVDENDSSSLAIAGSFAYQRGIPAENIIYLKGDTTWNASPYCCSYAAFLEHIYRPVVAELEERKLSHVLAWVYSSGFPVRINTGKTDALSLQGATWLGGALPSADDIKKGVYRSPIYPGPDPDSSQVAAIASFATLHNRHSEAWNWPSMMLGFTGDRGNSIAEIDVCIKRGALSDGSKPRGTVFLVTNNDVRSKCRAWMFQTVIDQLKLRGIMSETVGKAPRNVPHILGIMDGLAHVTPKQCGTFQAGAYADHLTSCGAIFNEPEQTKCTEWISAGATATAGAVVEPYALWTKFPTPIFFIHYASGLSMMESLFQSLRCPLQVLLLGEPLACPWRSWFSVTTIKLEENPGERTLTFISQVLPRLPMRMSFSYYLDGREIAKNTGDVLKLDANKCGDGWHRLRVVAETTGSIRHSSFSIHDFYVSRHDTTIQWTQLQRPKPGSLAHSYDTTLSTSFVPDRIGLMSNGRIIYEQIGTNNTMTIPFPPKTASLGYQTWQAFADQGTTRIFSEPYVIQVTK